MRLISNPHDSLKMSGLINTMGIAGACHKAAFVRKKNHVPPIRSPIQPITHESGLRNAIRPIQLSAPMTVTHVGYWGCSRGSRSAAMLAIR